MHRRAFCAGAGLLASVGATPLTAGVTSTADLPAARQGRLIAALDRVESVRAVKTLQHTLAQYIHHGLWREAASLFSAQGLWQRDTIARGPQAVEGALRATYGDGEDGLPPGTVHSALVLTPVVVLSPRGDRAHGRWHDITMTGKLRHSAAWAGGMWLVEYDRSPQGWRIATMRYHPFFAGSYDDGFRNVVEDLAEVPYVFTPEVAGTAQDQGGSLAAAEPHAGPLPPGIYRRIAALRLEDAARNLQGAYGYYLDRKQWPDIADLFTEDGAINVVNGPSARGRAEILNLLEARWGSAGLVKGELNDHPQFNVTIACDAGGLAATARGLELGMRGHNGAEAQWQLTTFETRVVQDAGVLKIAELRLYPEMAADYFAGWGKSDLLRLGPGGRAIAPFPDNPATGRPVALPRALTPAPAMAYGPVAGEGAVDLPEDLSAAETQLAAAAGIDAIDNLSSALGNYLNDSRWYELSLLFAEDGERVSPGAGWYRGRERIHAMQLARNGPRRRPRSFLPLHLRLQPVITMAPDGRSARMHVRLLQFNSAYQGQGSLLAGYYEDEFVLEDGRWRFRANEVEHVWRTVSLADGWARLPDGIGETLARRPDALLEAMPPDRPLTSLGYTPFPEIGPMRFHYDNPVSGRPPQEFRLPPRP
jgi:hypothetical protein